MGSVQRQRSDTFHHPTYGTLVHDERKNDDRLKVGPTYPSFSSKVRLTTGMSVDLVDFVIIIPTEQDFLSPKRVKIFHIKTHEHTSLLFMTGAFTFKIVS